MSSIRLFILGSLAARGPMHGHQLRLLAEEEHIDLWTDFTVGAVYGAIKRLAAEKLIAPMRTERAGNYPERIVYDVTDAGRSDLSAIRSSTLAEFTLRPDPFDLALARLDDGAVDTLPSTLDQRREMLASLLKSHHDRLDHAAPFLTVLETFALHHQRRRIEAEVEWLDSVIVALPEIIRDEKSRKDSRLV